MPIADFDDAQHLVQLEHWPRSYGAEELFDAAGKFRDDFASLAPTGHSRMGSNPHANGGEWMRALVLPDFRSHAVALAAPGGVRAAATATLGSYLKEAMALNLGASNMRLFGPDETATNRLQAVYDVTGKTWMAEVDPNDRPLLGIDEAA